MLQFPVNVFPNSQSIDGTIVNTFSFVFRGDILAKFQIKIYRNSTGALIYTSPEITTTKYNGDIVELEVPEDSFANGDDLVWTVKIWDSINNTVTSPSYFFKARSTPALSASGELSPHPSRKLDLVGVYSQEQNTPIRYHVWNLYDNSGNLVDTTGKVYSSNLSYHFDGLVSNRAYSYNLKVVNQDDVTISTEDNIFIVQYAAPDISVPPRVEFLPKKNAVKVSWAADRQSIGIATGDYSFIDDSSSLGDKRLKIESGTIYFDKVSGEDLNIKENDFTVVVSTEINEKTQGPFIELEDDIGRKYYLSADVYSFNMYKREMAYFIQNIFPVVTSGQTETGVPEENVGYIWDDDDVWDDSKFFTETLPFAKRYKIIVLPASILIQEEV